MGLSCSKICIYIDTANSNRSEYFRVTEALFPSLSLWQATTNP